ncbi:MAG: hypothetical protein Q4D04_15030, partial [Clostridia bacterium]|nr:hypothetical protein [Clostridia bacterium]
MKRSIDTPLGYLERLKPLYVSLFRMAHAIVGNLELAEYVFKSAIVEAFLRRGEWRDRMGFQDGLTHTVRAVALVELKAMRQAGSFDEDWELPLADGEGQADGLYAKIIDESDMIKRMAMLYYGCDLTPRQLGMVMNMRPSDALRRMNRLQSRLLRSSRGVARGQMEMLIEKKMMELLARPGDDVPEMGAVFRSFERDVDGAQKPRASAGRVVATVIKAVGAVVLALAFWLLAALIEPSNGTVPVASPVPVAEDQWAQG